MKKEKKKMYVPPVSLWHSAFSILAAEAPSYKSDASSISYSLKCLLQVSAHVWQLLRHVPSTS